VDAGLYGSEYIDEEQRKRKIHTLRVIEMSYMTFKVMCGMSSSELNSILNLEDGIDVQKKRKASERRRNISRYILILE
jgi:hypothetical protein